MDAWIVCYTIGGLFVFFIILAYVMTWGSDE